MSKTKVQALKQKKAFEKEYPHLKCIIVNDTDKFPRGSSMRYNFRFKERKSKNIGVR